MLARALRWTRGSFLNGVNGIDTSLNSRVPPGHDELVEGLARIIFKKGQVFYNPAQVVNRDLSVLILRWLQRERRNAPLRILEALSATGLRAVRYAAEVPNVVRVLANDLDPAAVQTIARNIAHNGDSVASIVKPNCGDAISVMTAARAAEEQYDVIDLDPYGGASPFLDSAVQAVKNGGILAVTCTDLAVLCGNSPETCFARYGATPLKGPCSHEMAIRIVLFAINAAANRHGRAIEVVFCCKIDFYVRLFVRIRDSKALSQLSQSRTASVFQCSSCGTQRFQPLGRVKENAPSYSQRRRKRGKHATQTQDNDQMQSSVAQTQEHRSRKEVQIGSGVRKFAPALVTPGVDTKCTICDGMMVVGGPIWAGNLVDYEVCSSILQDISAGEGALQARSRVDALLRVASEEVPDVPLFLQLNSMCKIIKCSAPPAAALRSYLVNHGYAVSQSHTDPLAIKTDSPPEVLWDLLRIWAKTVKQKQVISCLNGDIEAISAGERILAKEPLLVREEDVDFSIKKDQFMRRGSLSQKSAPRFLPNPEPFWGPKARAGKRKRNDSASSES